MAYKKAQASQCPQVFYNRINFDDVDNAGVAYNAAGASGPHTFEVCDVQPGRILKSMAVMVETAFNSGTSDVAVVGDVAIADRYMASQSIAVIGDKTTKKTGFSIPSTGHTLKAVLTRGAGAVPTAGAMVVIAEFIDPRREDEVSRLNASV